MKSCKSSVSPRYECIVLGLGMGGVIAWDDVDTCVIGSVDFFHLLQNSVVTVGHLIRWLMLGQLALVCKLKVQILNSEVYDMSTYTCTINQVLVNSGPWLVPTVILVVGWLFLFVRARLIEYRAARKFAWTFFQALESGLAPEHRTSAYMTIGKITLNITRMGSAFRAMHLLYMLGHTGVTRYVLRKAIEHEIPLVANAHATVISKQIVIALDMMGAFPRALTVSERLRVYGRLLLRPLIHGYDDGYLINRQIPRIK